MGLNAVSIVFVGLVAGLLQFTNAGKIFFNFNSVLCFMNYNRHSFEKIWVPQRHGKYSLFRGICRETRYHFA